MKNKPHSCNHNAMSMWMMCTTSGYRRNIHTSRFVSLESSLFKIFSSIHVSTSKLVKLMLYAATNVMIFSVHSYHKNTVKAKGINISMPRICWYIFFSILNSRTFGILFLSGLRQLICFIKATANSVLQYLSAAEINFKKTFSHRGVSHVLLMYCLTLFPAPYPALIFIYACNFYFWLCSQPCYWYSAHFYMPLLKEWKYWICF